MTMATASTQPSSPVRSKMLPIPLLALQRQIAERDKNHYAFEDSQINRNKETSMAEIVGRVWSLSQCPQGSRQVQSIIDDDIMEHERLALISELRGHVWQAMKCPHANYVLQKAITLVEPMDAQFILDEIEQGGANAIDRGAKLKCGCRIIQRLIENCTPEQMNYMSSVIISDVIRLSKHAHGNFVVKTLLQHGTKEQLSLLYSKLIQRVEELCMHRTAASVIGTAIEYGEIDQQIALARAVTECSGLVEYMFRRQQTRIIAKHIKRVSENAGGEENTEEAAK